MDGTDGSNTRENPAQLDQGSQLFYDISQAIAAAETVSDGLQAVLSEVCALTEWAYGEVWVPNEDRTRLRHDSSYTFKEGFDEFKQISRETTFARDEGLPGRVWESLHTEWIDDVAALPPEQYLRTDAAEQADLNAAYGVPIIAEDRLEAVLVFYLTETRPVDDRLSRIVETVAENLGSFVERKRTEQRLRAERSILGQLFESAPVGIVVVDPDGTVVRTNARAAEMLETAEQELLSSVYTEFDMTVLDRTGSVLAPDQRPISRVLETESPINELELGLEQQDGSRLWVSVDAAPLFDTDGQLERAIVVLKDVTNRSTRERELQTFKEGFEQAGAALYTLTTAGDIEYVNDQFEVATGYDRDTAIGATLESLLSNDDETLDALWSTVRDGTIWSGESTNQRANGESYPVARTVAPVTTAAGERARFIGIDVDISEQIDRETTLRHHRNSLDRTRRLLETSTDAHGAVLAASSAQAIRSAVCESLADSPMYSSAWVGQKQSDGTVSIRSAAGVNEQTLEESLTTDGVPDVFERAYETRTVQSRPHPTVDDDETADDTTDGRFTVHGTHAVCAVPIADGTTMDSVLCLSSTRTTAFEELEQQLLTTLGTRIALDIAAVTTRDVLQSDDRLELEFEVGPVDPLAACTDGHECRLESVRIVPSDDSLVQYLAIEGEPIDAVQQRLAASPAVTGLSRHQSAGETVLRCHTTTATLNATLERGGAAVRSATFADGTGRVIVEVSAKDDPQQLLEDSRDRFPDVELVTKRISTTETHAVPTSDAFDALTDKQADVLELAYRSGYFETPRQTDGNELAADLGVSPATVYQHLRRAQQTILELLLDDGG
ncbi:PAS domain S-box protein [Natronolimnobius sp. AArcel1]|uniref:PAS domain S-box protein n=1 Tax=Natronolimnobius sp. AArcel1 TaxID=1679093 RepID=UPI0013ECD8E1|nr:PAS domain S-box protein [Natronolimnobius sp. AArcel1]NGM70698.1 PAS domain S-box protein [Natronolimnobius sp. AArcel1]